MATLTRPESTQQSIVPSLLESTVPRPFPRDLLARTITPPVSESNDIRIEVEGESALELDVHSRADHSEAQQDLTTYTILNELMPSMACVQRTCLMTLNTFLSVPTRWNLIIPERRHSMPPNSHDASSSQINAEFSPSSALLTLVSNLRNRDSSEGMIEVATSSTDLGLIHELRVRVERISTTLDPLDAQLAVALVSLFSHVNRLSVILSATQSPSIWAAVPETLKTLEKLQSDELESSTDLFSTLKRQLNDFQLERLSSRPQDLAPGASPIVAVETALLWSKIDEELETVVSMCKGRAENLPRFPNEPPQYDDPEFYQFETLPEYEYDSPASVDGKARSTQHSATTQTSEKMRLDLEAVTLAIDRLYLVAPQLHNQRVELKSSKLAQMERARQEGIMSSQSRGKQKQRKTQELDNLLELLGRATDRTLHSQSVVLDGNMQVRLEKARLRDQAKREEFVQQLAEHSDSGRFHGQDAAFLPPRPKDPHTLLSLPDFIRETVPRNATRQDDPYALLTLPEFVRESLADHEDHSNDKTTLKPEKGRRDRSLSAPSFSWLLAHSPRTLGLGGSNQGKSKFKASGTLTTANVVTSLGFDVAYVAENHENLHHVLVFMSVTGATPGVGLEAEVLPPFPEPHTEGGDRLLIKCGTQSSLPLCLPGRVSPGQKDMKIQSGHYEIKLPTALPEVTTSSNDVHTSPLLDAWQLLQASPTSFICASCSLPLVSLARINSYRDLPSEHWEELVDAWMCHSDQKLHEQVSKHGRVGFWPESGIALVGGSYILFDMTSIVSQNLSQADQPKKDDGSRLVRCLCGAVIGRSQTPPVAADSNSTAYKLLKYAIRPISPVSEVYNQLKIPLSAFIVADMMEFVQAHATYRFIILDEEEERARILIWLFKPSIKLAYTAPNPYTIPKSGSIHAAKVLYKVLSPSDGTPDLKSLLNKYPGFPQAEYLYYPLMVCRRVTRLLRDSTTAYPEVLRTMTGLDVGWLARR